MCATRTVIVFQDRVAGQLTVEPDQDLPSSEAWSAGTGAYTEEPQPASTSVVWSTKQLTSVVTVLPDLSRKSSAWDWGSTREPAFTPTPTPKSTPTPTPRLTPTPYLPSSPIPTAPQSTSSTSSGAMKGAAGGLLDGWGIFAVAGLSVALHYV